MFHLTKKEKKKKKKKGEKKKETLEKEKALEERILGRSWFETRPRPRSAPRASENKGEEGRGLKRKRQR